MPKHKRILLIDDDGTTNLLNKIIIEKSNLVDEVVSFTEAQNALSYLKNNENSNEDLSVLIFLDVNMPIMNGWEFITKYAKLEENHNNKKNQNTIVLLTSSIDPADKAKAAEIEEISEYQSKPLSVRLLNNLVSKYLD